MQDPLKEILEPTLSGKSDYLILMIFASFRILNYKYNQCFGWVPQRSEDDLWCYL